MSPTLGKVLLFKGGDWISWVVKWQSRSIYSHAALLIPGTLTCIESYPGVGVRHRDLTAEDLDRADIYDVAGLTPEGWQKAIEFAEKQMGKSYDWLGVFRFMDKVPARDNNRWFCSELVHKSIAEGGVRLLERIPSAEVSPMHLGISPLMLPYSEESPKVTNTPTPP